MSDRRPFFKFPEGRNATEAKLKFDQPLEKEGQYGPYWLYKMDINGQEETVPASKSLHEAIQATGAKAGSVISVIRMGEGKDTRYDVVDTQNLDGGASEQQLEAEADRVFPPKPQPSAKTEFYTLLKKYKIAWGLAEKFLDGKQGEVNAVAFTFYKMAQDVGYDLRKEEGDAVPFDQL